MSSDRKDTPLSSKAPADENNGKRMKSPEVLSQAMMNKKSSSIYARIVERKTNPPVKTKSASISEQFMNIFSRESAEV
jgi:hypothetical protein